jgi:hypothetical protein
MSGSTTSTIARTDYSLDLSGLIAHAADTLAAYAARIRLAPRPSAELPRSRVGPLVRSAAGHHVPDSVRVR